MQLELARSMSYYATLKVGEPAEGRRRAIAQAQVQLGRSMRLIGQEGVQMHGGIGVTDEYMGSHYFKRLTCMEMTYGDTMHHLAQVGSRMRDTAGVFAAVQARAVPGRTIYRGCRGLSTSSSAQSSSKEA
jgi:alkylation response protein AidB-like acyl-CoA dehydrogenase